MPILIEIEWSSLVLMSSAFLRGNKYPIRSICTLALSSRGAVSSLAIAASPANGSTPSASSRSIKSWVRLLGVPAVRPPVLSLVLMHLFYEAGQVFSALPPAHPLGYFLPVAPRIAEPANEIGAAAEWCGKHLIQAECVPVIPAAFPHRHLRDAVGLQRPPPWRQSFSRWEQAQFLPA